MLPRGRSTYCYYCFERTAIVGILLMGETVLCTWLLRGKIEIAVCIATRHYCGINLCMDQFPKTSLTMEIFLSNKDFL